MDEEDVYKYGDGATHNGDCKYDYESKLNINTESETLQIEESIGEQCEDAISSSFSTTENIASSHDNIRSSDKGSEQSFLNVKIKEEPFHLVDYDTDGTTDDENENNTKNYKQYTHNDPEIPSTICTSKVLSEDIWNAAVMGNVDPEKSIPSIPDKDKVVLPLPAFFHDYERKESSDSESDSSDSTVSVLSIESSDSASDTNCVIIENKEAKSKQSNKNCKKQSNLNPYRTHGELSLEDLPPIEDLYITVPEKDIFHIGKVSSVVQTQVIIQTFENQRALDLDTVLFLKDGTSLGKVFDVFGRVAAPFYSVRFNTEEDIKNKEIEVGCDVYCAPTHDEVTKFVFTDKLLTQKGSDASWKDNNEPPEECLEFSDDEQEKLHKMKLKAKRKRLTIEDSDLQIVHSNVTNGKNQKPRNRNTRGSHTRPLVRPNRFNAPTPDLNSTNGQSAQSNIQQWNNFYQPQNNQSYQQSRGAHQNYQWSDSPHYPNYQMGPSLLANPYVFGTRPSMFNNGYANNQYSYPSSSVEEQFHNPPVGNNQPFQPSWPLFAHHGPPNQFNQPGQFIGPPNRPEGQLIGPPNRTESQLIGSPNRPEGQFIGPPNRPEGQIIGPPNRPEIRRDNQFFNMCFSSLPPPPPPPPPELNVNVDFI